MWFDGHQWDCHKSNDDSNQSHYVADKFGNPQRIYVDKYVIFVNDDYFDIFNYNNPNNIDDTLTAAFPQSYKSIYEHVMDVPKFPIISEEALIQRIKNLVIFS
jgi:hypothetical protein